MPQQFQFIAYVMYGRLRVPVIVLFHGVAERRGKRIGAVAAGLFLLLLLLLRIVVVVAVVFRKGPRSRSRSLRGSAIQGQWMSFGSMFLVGVGAGGQQQIHALGFREHTKEWILDSPAIVILSCFERAHHSPIRLSTTSARCTVRLLWLNAFVFLLLLLLLCKTPPGFQSFLFG